MEVIKNINTKKNPFLLFLPFLILYVLIILILAKNVNDGDESRYLTYAKNLIHGFYTLPAPNLDLGNGPGYPIIITPFVALKLPVIYIKLMNALFYYFSTILLYKALQQIVPSKFALVFGIIWALYPNTFESMPYTLNEVFASSLMPLIIFTLIKAFQNDNTKKARKYILFAGLSFGYLALTKPIFGYVLIVMIIGTMLIWILNRKKTNLKQGLAVLTIAFIITIPWLTYTYHMTGKILYWSSFGGNNLYWMSSPYENEYGDWMPYLTDSPDSTVKEKYHLPGTAEQVRLQHQEDFEQILASKQAQDLYVKNGVISGSPYTGVIQDNTLKRIAFQNIKSHPLKFIQNCISNAGRMIFNYPNAYTIQKPSTLRRLPVNGAILVFAAFCFIVTLANWKRILFPIRFLLFIGLLYFGGSLLGSAGPRMFSLAVPILLIWIAYIISKSVKVKLKFE
ncbi:MAG TPA: glycosyltransferase family 39 protein [Hanamia sp.]